VARYDTHLRVALCCSVQAWVWIFPRYHQFVKALASICSLAVFTAGVAGCGFSASEEGAKAVDIAVAEYGDCLQRAGYDLPHEDDHWPDSPAAEYRIAFEKATGDVAGETEGIVLIVTPESRSIEPGGLVDARKIRQAGCS
jgi:hypothetical protein